MKRIPSRAVRRRNGFKPPTGVAMSYMALFRKYIDKYQRAALPKILAAYEKRMRLHLDAHRIPLPIKTQEIFEDPALTTDIRTLAARVNSRNKIDFRRVVGISPHSEAGTGAAIEAFRERNVNLFKSIAGDELDRMSEILDEAERGAWTVETLGKSLEAEFEVTKSKADFWARDQVLKLNGQLTQMRQTNAGVTKYIWTTSGDERVRETHAELDGTTQSWSDPPVVSEDGSTGNPGDDYQCRCTAFPILDEVDDTE